MRHSSRRSVLAVLACFMVFGCTQKTEEPTQLTFPAGAEDTVSIVAGQLAENNPEVLWEALPESYRADVNELTLLFAEKMDPAIYDRAMSLGLRTVQLLQDKQEIILSSDTVAHSGIDIDEIGAKLTGSLAVVQTVLSSEISTIAGLSAIDWQNYLEGSGSLIMEQADAMDTGEGEDPFLMLETFEMETLEETDTTAKLRITAEGHDPEEIDLVLVEDRWVPAELAEAWPGAVETARERLTAITPEQIEEIKGQAMLGFAMAEGFVGQLEKIQTSEDFDAAFGSMLQGVIGSIAAYLPTDDEEAPATE